MIFQPRVGQEYVINYKDKTMPYQGHECEVAAVAKGKGPRNVLVIVVSLTEFLWNHVVVPRGNLCRKILA
jgi:hypothetical protein